MESSAHFLECAAIGALDTRPADQVLHYSINKPIPNIQKLAEGSGRL